MLFLNFGSNKNKYCNLSDMNFLMKNMKNRNSDPGPLFPNVDLGSGSTFSKCGSKDPDPDPRQNEMDPKPFIKSENQHAATISLVNWFK